MRVEQCPSLDDLHATIDHRPLRLCLDLTLDSINPSCRRRIDVRALHTAEGLSAVERAFRTMPLIPWGVDSTTHVALLHTHLRGSLAASLPVLKSRPRNPAYSEATIDLVRVKRRTRKRVRELYAQERAYILEAVFTVWARCSPPLVEPAPAPAVTMPVLSECRRHRTRVLASLHCQEGLLRTRMKADKAAFLREEMQQARDLGSANFAHRIRSVLRTGRKFKAPALLPTLFPHTDAEAAGQEAVMHAMGTHYALAERATESTTVAQLSRRCEAPTCPLDAVLVAQDMPSLPALARSIAGIQCRKASGISGIPPDPDVYRLAPHLSAIALFPIYSKLVAQGVCPLQWGGGNAHSIPKGSGLAADMSGWRSIMLLEPEAKAIQKAWRASLLAFAADKAPAGQHGGFPGHTLSMVAFRVRAHFLALRHRGMCGGALFLDCKSAYYSVVRDLLTLPAGCLADPQSLYSRACQLFQSEAARQRFVNDMWLGGALQQGETDACLCRFVRAQTSGAWFTTDATGCTLWATQSGTAPGSPIADALFAIVYASFLTDVQSRLHAQGCTSVEVCGCGDSAVPTWADDTAILFGVRTAADVLPALGQVASAACNGMQRLGLTPNFGPGKTEAVLLLQGVGSKRLKQQELCSETPGIFFTDCQGDRRFVRIVTAYTHLGTVLRADGHEIPNIRHRAGLMRRTLGPLRSKVFSNPFVTAAEKRLLFEQRVLPKFLYGAGLWRLSTMHEEQAALEPIRMAMRGSFRALTGYSCQALSAKEIAAVLDLPTAEDFLATKRIRTVREVAQVHAESAWTAFCQDGHWLTQVGVDLSVALRLLDSTLVLPLPSPPAAVLAFVRRHCSSLRWTGRHYLRRCRATQAELRCRVLASLVSPPSPVDAPILVSDEDTAGLGVPCHLCNKLLPCRRTLAVHLARRHGVDAAATQVAHGTRCEVCGMEFWATDRLRVHLRKSRSCLLVYDHGDQERNPETEVLDRLVHASRPAVRTAGPRPWWAQLCPG